MVFVCGDCGVIAKADGIVVEQPIKQPTQCMSGCHTWKDIGAARLSKTALLAVYAYRKKVDQATAAAEPVES